MAKVRQDILHIQEAAEKMRFLLDDLLALSRIGRVTEASQDVSFNSLVEQAIKLVTGQIRHNNVEITVMSDMPMVFVDGARVIEVLQNLIDNAIKFMGSQPKPHIEIGYTRSKNEPLFFVRDNGKGIAPQFHEQVFGLFNRLDQSVAGTGIGLALVKRIIEVHNGRIWIESDGKGNGTTFFFTLGKQSA